MSDNELVSVLARFIERGVTPTKGQIISAGRRAAAMYRKAHESDPPRTPEIVIRGHDLLGDNGVPTMVFGYSRADLGLLNAAIDSVLSGARAPVRGKLKPRGKEKRRRVEQERLGPPYITESYECWSCGEDVLVYSWEGHAPWGGGVPPPPPVPSTLSFRWSSTAGREYKANNCAACGAMLGDYFLHFGRGPFSRGA